MISETCHLSWKPPATRNCMQTSCINVVRTYMSNIDLAEWNSKPAPLGNRYQPVGTHIATQKHGCWRERHSAVRSLDYLYTSLLHSSRSCIAACSMYIKLALHHKQLNTSAESVRYVQVPVVHNHLTLGWRQFNVVTTCMWDSTYMYHTLTQCQCVTRQHGTVPSLSNLYSLDAAATRTRQIASFQGFTLVLRPIAT